ncbi:type II CAAX prenyl endopeptidase Rce1 family protein [Amycolatopsis suaedae]|uniref:CPBP family intramembrane metalloprotease n=1 Tax=Amycolatopsis suaedae TaxID=2510978 RepID=A0A4Q7J6J8_9PSEU|nr:CPBP family glutamic-type intramembrane protease [Amycolatopsis suaedae]RZQ62518.1 CPBP family intramembrane metalloprotease [Amycolatopsis suaedae]
MAVLLVVLAAHLALPWVLARLARRSGERRAVAVLRQHGTAVYGYATTVLGTLALIVLSGQTAVPWWQNWPVSVAAAGIGVVLPLLSARLAGKPLRPFARPLPPAGELVPMVTGVAAEEVLWRLAAVTVAVHFGLPLAVAVVLAVAAFAVLHVPASGPRAVPYQTVFGLLLTGIALTGGLLAALVCHLAHNLTLACARKLVPARKRAKVAGVPPSSSW